MPDLPWDRFRELPGDPRRNWEVFCRELVRRNYERFGPLLTRKQQPGVEFHLEVRRGGGPLGESARHWGWQCRWYDSRDGGRLGSARRRGIEEALEKSASYLPGLTDWVLWTREKLGAEDARWFDGLAAPFELHRWDEETAIGLLGDGHEVLRQTWFGELVMDDRTMARLRQEALAPIRQRYKDTLHIRTPSEIGLRWILPDTEAIEVFAKEELDVSAQIEDLTRAWSGTLLSRDEEQAFEQASFRLHAMARHLRALREALERGELPTAEWVSSIEVGPDPETYARANRRLEADNRERMLTSLAASFAVLGMAKESLAELAEGLATPLVAVVGGAGAGKTHLAANLTGPEEGPRGVLALGRHFGPRIGDDDLASAAGLPGPSRDEFLEALEARGARLGRRIPLAIDGLNESEDPREWKGHLARLGARLKDLRHVVALVTVRPSYVEFALPDDLPRIDLPGFTGVVEEAVERYFDHYRIKADPRELHWWPPTHPLLLSIFCRTVNPERRHEVVASQLPDSLTEVFDAYLGDVYRRIATTMEIEPESVAAAVSDFAHLMFTRGGRTLDREEARVVLGDDRRARWAESLRFQLEAEELLMRDVMDGADRVLWNYDLLGGYAIARSFVERGIGPDELEDPGFLSELEAHPLCEDAVVGLSGLLSQDGVDLTHLLSGRSALYRTAVLALPRLPASEVGPASVETIKRVFGQYPEETLDALLPTAFAPGHALNATALDSLLSDLPAWRRDLAWTEWVRSQADSIRAQVRKFSAHWRDGEAPDEDDAALCWLSWLLTSPDKRLRDEATEALYRFGRLAPDRLFRRALGVLGVNDPTVPEGLLAASYGVAMAAQDPRSSARDDVVAFATELDARLLGEDATEPTAHWLNREYAYRTAQLAGRLSGGELPAPPGAAQPPLPRPGGPAAALAPGDEGWEAVEGVFHGEFSHHTIALLEGGESSYREDPPGVSPAMREVRARIAELGWNEERFAAIDGEIGGIVYTRHTDPERLERYGEKYGWAAFYEAAGRLSDRGELRAVEDGSWRLPDLPIDPSFPGEAETALLGLPDWTAPAGADEEWLRDGPGEIPNELLRIPEAEGEAWVMVDGLLRQEPRNGRGVSCRIRGVLALGGWPSVESYVAEHGLEPAPVRLNPSSPHCFAGEVPWAAAFDGQATAADGSFGPNLTSLGREREGPRVEVELLGVDLCWESTRGGGAVAEFSPVPGKNFANHAGLLKLPERLVFVDSDGELAAVSVEPGEDGWAGRALLVREDLLRAYCADRGGEWGWIAEGRRELLHRTPPQSALREIRRKELDRFHRVAALAEVASSAFPGAT